MDVQLGYIQASKNIEFFKVRLRWSKLSRLLQRIAFSCFRIKIGRINFFQGSDTVYITNDYISICGTKNL